MSIFFFQIKVYEINQNATTKHFFWPIFPSQKSVKPRCFEKKTIGESGNLFLEKKKKKVSKD